MTTSRLKPSFFLVENVAGLARIKQHRRYLDKQLGVLRSRGGFAVDYTVLNALEYGVPQSRERLFVVGFRKNIARVKTVMNQKRQAGEA